MGSSLRLLTNLPRFLFLTYPDAQQAEHALRVLDGTQFGKHVLYVNRFGDIERYANMPLGEGELPTGWREKSYVEKVSRDLGILWIGTDTFLGPFTKLAW